MERNRRVGKAKRAHHFTIAIGVVGTAPERLCPPYDRHYATAAFGAGREIASVTRAATMQSAPATKNAGR